MSQSDYLKHKKMATQLKIDNADFNPVLDAQQYTQFKKFLGRIKLIIPPSSSFSNELNINNIKILGLPSKYSQYLRSTSVFFIT